MLKKLICAGLLLLNIAALGQGELQLGSIGRLTTQKGGTIENCILGYRTFGKLNETKSNAVLWTTWLMGTSYELANAIPLFMDTNGLFIIVTDALGNGVSSSPSNTESFPSITIHDMVVAQHLLLTKVLKIDHLKAVVGKSMGGFQTFEWITSFPGFMDKAIPIAGTPKQSFYDILQWQTLIKILQQAKSGTMAMQTAMELCTDIITLQQFSPRYLATTQHPDSVNAFLTQSYKQMRNAANYLSQLEAIMTHDITRTVHSQSIDIKQSIKCQVLVIVATEDHLVNPINAIRFAEENDYPLQQINGQLGHLAPYFQAHEVRKSIDLFLK